MHEYVRVIGSLSVCAAMLMLGAVAGHSFLAPEPPLDRVCSILEHGNSARAVEPAGGRARVAGSCCQGGVVGAVAVGDRFLALDDGGADHIARAPR